MKFIEKALKGALSFLKEAVFSEEAAGSGGMLQLLEPRLKIVIFLFLIILSTTLKSIPYLAILYLISIILAMSSGIRLSFFLKRVWLFIPVFTLFIAIPAVFLQGVRVAAVFVLRVTTCVSFAVLMTITTRHNELLKSLRSFGVPNIFIQILDMTYRYIFFFVKTFEEMHTGLKARLVQKMDQARARRWVASRIGYLFKRSIKMGEDVYMAMLARGYTGEIKTYDR